MSKEQIKQIAVEGVCLIKKLLPELPDTEVQLEYSPESFSDTEEDFALGSLRSCNGCLGTNR